MGDETCQWKGTAQCTGGWESCPRGWEAARVRGELSQEVDEGFPGAGRESRQGWGRVGLRSSEALGMRCGRCRCWSRLYSHPMPPPLASCCYISPPMSLGKRAQRCEATCLRPHS